MASDGKSVKFLTKPLDVLRTKTSTVHNAPAHPVQAIQERHQQTVFEGKLSMLAKIHGVHVPMRIKMDNTILAQQRRPGVAGIRQSMVGLETMLGKDETIEFEDYLNDPEFTEQIVDVHTELEAAAEATGN